MDILAALATAKQKTKPEVTPQQSIVQSRLYSLGLDQDIIDDVMLEPAETWLDFVNYFEGENT